MVNYQNSKIYKIINKDLDVIFVGSTTSNLRSKLFQFKKKHDINDVKIILVENVSCNNRSQLTLRENYWREKLKYKHKDVNTCEHNKRRLNCSECSPAICAICKIRYPAGYIAKHFSDYHSFTGECYFD
jgi:hypothetical protein